MCEVPGEFAHVIFATEQLRQGLNQPLREPRGGFKPQYQVLIVGIEIRVHQKDADARKVRVTPDRGAQHAPKPVTAPDSARQS
jgi:hypothetical protein